MTTLLPPPPAPAPSGRRPALIPHHNDLTISLSAASAALSAASYSPARESNRGVWTRPHSCASDSDGDVEMSMSLEDVGEVRRDVFSWVNARPNDEMMDVDAGPGEADESMMPPPMQGKKFPLELDTSARVPERRSGQDTVPASPCTGGEAELERQKRRLEEAAAAATNAMR